MKMPEGNRTASLTLFLVVLTAFLAVGLMPGRESQAQVSALPLDFQDVVIFATNSARLKNGVTVVAGHVVVNDASTGPTLSSGVELGVGDKVVTPAGYSLAADSIGIGGGTTVGGSVFYNTLKNKGKILGASSTPLALPVFAPLPVFKSAPAGTQDVSVAKNQVQTLVPGAYRDIKLQDGATLTLSPGAYSVRSIKVATKGRLLFANLSAGESEVMIANGFTTGDGCSVGPDDSDPLKASKIIFYVASSPPKPVGVDIGNRNTIQANFYAPNEKLAIDNDSVATGQFLARDVEMGDRVRVDLEGAFGSAAPAITSADATTFIVGQAGTFTVTTTGTPPVTTITRGGVALPGGVNYVDNGDGTATLSGTPDPGTAASYVFTFTASNGVPPDAVQDPFTLTINKQAQTITFTSSAPGAATVGGPTYNVTATATSGLAVAFTIDASASTVCSIAGSTVSFIGAGTCVINADQTGNGTYDAAPQVQQSFAVGKNPQTISFTSSAPGAATVGGPTYNVTATATSGLPVAFTIDASASTVCTIAVSTVSFIGVGTCVINANQAGNGTYDAAPEVQQSFAVGKGAQTIIFTSVAPTDATPGGPTYNVTATATSGLPVAFTIDASATSVCSIAGSTVSFIANGTCVIDANQAGNANYDPAPQVQQSFAVKSPQTISFTSSAPTNAVVGGPTYTVTATATSGLTVAFTIDATASTVCSIAGATVSFIGAGTCVINANQAGDANYFPAPQVQQSFIVKLTQTISFTSTAPPAAVYQGPTYNVTATATSGLTVTLTIDASASTVCSLSGSTVSFIGTGTCTINASQPGDGTYAPAPPVQQSFTVGPNLVGDSYSVVGNTQFVAAGQSTPTTPFTADPTTILANDTADVAITLTTVTNAATTGGGLITIDANGKFTYTPPVGQSSGTDTYVYTGTANGVSRTATITFNISNIVWYVDNASSGAHDGRSNSPFLGMGSGAGNLGSALSNAGPAAGAYIYVFKGSGTTTGAYTFKASQTLIGAGATLSVGALTIAGNASNAPTLGGTLTLANSVTTNGFDLSTGASNGIVGSSVTGVSVTARTVTAAGGIAVNLVNSDGTFTFTRIDANGGSNGIVWNNASAATGSFAVTGSGGSCTPATPTCSGGRIQNMTGADDSGVAPVGTGIALNNARNVSLTRMRIDSHSNYAIRGTSVNGFTFDNGLVDGANGTNVATPFNDGSLVFHGVTGVSSGMTGTSAITNSTISGGHQRNISIDNSVGTLNLTINNSAIKRTSDAAGDDGLLIEADTSANVTVAITNNTFARHGGDHINLSLVNNAVMDATISGNTLHGNYTGTPEGDHPIGLGQGIFILGGSFNGTFTYDILNNTIKGNRQGGAIHVNKGSGAATFSGTVSGNTVGDAAINGSGSSEASGIDVEAHGAGGSHTTVISNNTVRQFHNDGILILAGEGNAALNATVTGNTVSNPDASVASFHGVHFNIGTLPTDATPACLDVRNNTLTIAANEANGGVDLRMRQRQLTTVRLPGYGGANNDNAAVQTFLTVTNANALTTILASNTVATGGGGYVGGAACPLP